MDYKVNTKRIKPGEYALSYGKGSKKITAIANVQDDKTWLVRELPWSEHLTEQDYLAHRILVTGDSLRHAKHEFEVRAAALYGKPRVTDIEERSSKTDRDEWPPGWDPTVGEQIIDGIPHRYYPPTNKPDGLTLNVLNGPWLWRGKDGLNPAQRRTNSYWTDTEGATHE